MERVCSGHHCDRTRGIALLALGLVAVSFSELAAAELTVAERLQLVEDRLAIEHLMTAVYPKALDSADWKTYASLFADDGVLIQGESRTVGPAAIEARFSAPRTAGPGPAGAPREPRATRHVVTNVNIELDGDRATATAYWQTISIRATETVIAGAGHYEDVLVRRDGEWKFAAREIVNTGRELATQAGD